MSKSVLIVDDNAFIRTTLCRLFTSREFHVCGEAENGQQAIARAQEMNPDLIVMDLSMPVMNGLQAVSALKRLMPNVPIILFSDYSDTLSKQVAQSAGFSALVSKSQPASALIAAARELCFPSAA